MGKKKSRSYYEEFDGYRVTIPRWKALFIKTFGRKCSARNMYYWNGRYYVVQ